MPERYDATVIGGAPAGSTAAAVLASKGRRVVDFSFREFVTADPHWRGDMTDCLIGHLFRDSQPLFDALSTFAAVPEPMPRGTPCC
jgi:flavin-dependent dehydrogenase